MIGRDPVYETRKKVLLETLNSFYPNKKENLNLTIVDLGSNNGDTCKAFYDLGFNVIGLEGDEKLISSSEKSYPKIKFIKSDFEKKLNIPDSSVNIIWAGDVIEHLNHTDNFLKEINRILNHKGILILSTPYHGLIKNLATVLLRFDKHFNPREGHLRFYTKKSLFGQLKDCGFEIIKYKLLGRIKLLAKNLFVIARKIK